MQASTDIAHFTIDIPKNNYARTDMHVLFPEFVYMAEERVILVQVCVFGFRIQIAEVKSIGLTALDLDEFNALLTCPTSYYHHQIFYCLW